MTRAQLQSAQETITRLQSELDAVKSQRNVESRGGRETRDLEKELGEVKDQNAALQSQLQEYIGVVTDQSKVGHLHTNNPQYILVEGCIL